MAATPSGAHPNAPMTRYGAALDTAAPWVGPSRAGPREAWGRLMSDQPRVLIVEDDALTALMLSNLMREMGCEVCGLASTAPRGVALADHYRPDLVLLDLRLGKGTDGVAAAREMSQTLKLDVLVISGATPQEVTGEAVADLPWIQKPFMPDQVMKSVGRILATQTDRPASVGPAIARRPAIRPDAMAMA